jgi:hypothetical protein
MKVAGGEVQCPNCHAYSEVGLYEKLSVKVTYELECPRCYDPLVVAFIHGRPRRGLGLADYNWLKEMNILWVD